MSRKLLLAITLIAASTATVITYLSASPPAPAVASKISPANTKSSDTQQAHGHAKVETPVSGFIYQRLGAAAAGVEQRQEYWIGLSATGDSVLSVKRKAGEPLAPDSLFHAFAVNGSVKGRPDGARVDSISVFIRLASGEKTAVTLNGTKVDALFWGTGAVNKFVAPYYAAVLGPQYVNEIIRLWNREGPWRGDVSIAALCHTPTSEPCSEKGVISLEEAVTRAVSAMR